MEHVEHIDLTREEYIELRSAYKELSGCDLDINYFNNIETAILVVLDRRAMKIVKDQQYWANMLELTSSSCWSYKV